MSDKIFERQLTVMKAFKRYVSDQGIRLPSKATAKRDLFVSWFLVEFQECDIDTIINELSNNFLFLSEKTTESIIFNNAKRSSKN